MKDNFEQTSVESYRPFTLADKAASFAGGALIFAFISSQSANLLRNAVEYAVSDEMSNASAHAYTAGAAVGGAVVGLVAGYGFLQRNR